MAKLANDQGLMPLEDSPDSEYVRTNNLNLILRHLGVSCARLHPFTLKLGPANGNMILGPVPGYSVVERDPSLDGIGEGASLIAPLEVILYIFLAYLTNFVYSSVVL